MQIEKIKIVLADNDLEYTVKLRENLKKEKMIEVVGIASDGETAMQLIEQLKPDIVVLDILMPKKDGLWVLEEMKRKKIKTTHCIVVSKLDGDTIVKNATTLGAVYYLLKPIQLDILIKRIIQFWEENKKHTQPNKSLYDLLEENECFGEANEKRLECKVSQLFNKMEISASIKGYHYLRTAIMMGVNDENVLIGITKGLYPDIAKQYNTTSSKVERAIRHAIESSWKKSGKKIYEEIANCLCGHKPTNGQFIAALTEYFRLGGKLA